MAASQPKLTLTVFSAEGLHEHGKIKKQDPYVIVEVGERTFKTKSDRSAGANPVWNEELQCEVAPGVTHANFTLHDHNYLVRDDVIGVAKYDFTRSSGQEETIPVYAKTGEPAGHMRLRAIYTGSKGAGVGSGAGHAMGATAAGLGAGAAGATAAHHGAGTGMLGQHGTAQTGVAGQHGTAQTSDRSVATGTGVGTGMGAGAGAGTGAGVMAGHHGTAQTGTTTSTGTTRGAPGFTGEMTNLTAGGTVCDQKFYTVEEDRPLVKEVKQYVREHHPVEREMVHQVKTTGREKEMATGPSELVNVEERVVDRTIPKPCP